MPESKSPFLGAAFRAAILAGDYIVSNLGQLTGSEIEVKQTSDFVTKVDKESERLILETIGDSFPDHHFLAEESGADARSAEYRWIVDPLDGTTNFIHQYPQFSVSIALQHNQRIILGVVYDPLRDEMFTAEQGHGAFLNGKKISVSTIARLENSLVTTGFPFRKKDLIDPYLKLFKNIFYRVSDIRRAGSAALDLAYLAAGRCDSFFEIGLSPWDIAAGSLLIQEAGGIISDFRGESDFLDSGNIVAGSPALHPEILKEVQIVFQGVIDR